MGSWLDRLNFGAWFTMGGVPQAVSGLGQIHRSFLGVHQAVSMVQHGLNRLVIGLPMLAIAAGALAIPASAVTGMSLEYEKALSGVRAVTFASNEEMRKINDNILDLSASTVYTARQVAEATEMMGRAGFKTNEIIGATAGVLSAAAAEGMELSKAADIIAKTVRTFNLQAKDATHVADVLALASASATTTIVELGEALKYGGTQAVLSGMSLEEFIAASSMIANRSITASRAGTNMAQAMLQLVKPTKKAKEIFREMGLGLDDVSIKASGFEQVMMNLSEGLLRYEKEHGPRLAEAAAAEIFKNRGLRAAMSFIQELRRNKDIFAQYVAFLKDADGAAQAMATVRMDNVLGKLTLIKSAIEAAAIEFEATLLPRARNALQKIADKINSVGMMLRILRSDKRVPKMVMPGPMGAPVITEAQEVSPEEWFRAKVTSLLKARKQIGYETYGFLDPSTAMSIANGLIDGIKAIHNTVDWFMIKVEKWTGRGSWFARVFGEEDRIRRITKNLVILAAAGAVFGPLILTLSTVGFMIQGLTLTMSAFSMIMKGMLTPLIFLGKGFGQLPKLGTAGFFRTTGAAAGAAALGMTQASGGLAATSAAAAGTGASLTGVLASIGPVGWALIALAAIAGIAAIKIIKMKAETGTLADSFSTIKDVGVGAFGIILGILVALKDVVDGLSDSFADIGLAVGAVFAGDKGTAEGARKFGGFVETLGKIVEWSIRVVGAIAAIVFWVEKLWLVWTAKDMVKGWNRFSAAVSKIPERVDKVQDSVSSLITTLATKMGGLNPIFLKILEVIGTVAIGVAEMGKKIETTFSDLPGKMNTFLRDMAGGLVWALDTIPGFAKALDVDDAKRDTIAAFAKGEGYNYAPERKPKDYKDPNSEETSSYQSMIDKIFQGLDVKKFNLPKLETLIEAVMGDVNVNLDGEAIAKAQAKYQLTLSERGGANVEPWQREAVHVRGASK